ncbi:MFS transporter [Streptomyces sp. RGM 3693]|uniref:MFS transporter n=1 Tax=Streptomyces sp. RGM 3693 TaxID=3413284 RepID=UPI003D2B6A4B
MLLTLVILPTSVTGSGVALPHIGRDTGAPLDTLQWVVHAYNLTFACAMLACGSLADLLGRRRLFAAGAVVFTLASLASAVAPGVLLLDVLRAVAGIGAAALLTSGSSILATAFEGAARTRVFAAVGIATGGGLALGATIAGTLADTVGWRWFFAAHGVLMVVVLCAVPVMPQSRRADASGLDLPGTGAFVTGLFLLMLGMVEGPQWGWGSPRVLGLLAGAVLLAVVFVRVERRSRHPMLDLGLLRNRRFLALCLIPVAVSCSFVILLPLLPNYLTVADGMTSRAAGGVLLLMTAPVLFAPPLAGRLITWGLSQRAVFSLSLACLTLGVAWLAVVLRPGAGPAALAAPLLVLGVGLGLNFGLVDGAVLTVVAPESTGTAAGLLNTLRLGSEAVAIAAAGSALTGLTRLRLEDGLPRFSAYREGSAALANSVNAGDLSGPASAVPAAVRPGFTAFAAHGFTTAWQLVLGVAAVLCALLWLVIHRMLAPSTADATAPGRSVAEPSVVEPSVVEPSSGELSAPESCAPVVSAPASFALESSEPELSNPQLPARKSSEREPSVGELFNGPRDSRLSADLGGADAGDRTESRPAG